MEKRRSTMEEKIKNIFRTVKGNAMVGKLCHKEDRCDMDYTFDRLGQPASREAQMLERYQITC